MSFKRLLAKRSQTPDDPDDRETLAGHLLDVARAAGAILSTVGARISKSAGLSDAYQVALAQALPRAALLHDLGKANHQFQRMLRSGQRLPQALWHEWISTWSVFHFPEFDQWLFGSCSATVRRASLYATLGHHLRVDDLASLRPRPGSGDPSLTFLGGHADVRSCLQVAQRKLGLPEGPALSDFEIDLLGDELAGLRNWLCDAADEGTDGATARFIAFIKALLIAADVAGSAVPRVMSDPEQWTATVLRRVCSAEELRSVAEARLAGSVRRPFQERLADSDSPVTFVRAGCGTGKTVGAYLWASQWAAGRKLFFCYPTTGTATEGYRDYIIPSELKAEAALLHSRSEVDLEDLVGLQDHDLAGDGALKVAPAVERAVRIESLLMWDVPLVVCTVDQVLGLMQNGRRGLFSFPAIANGAFVFDEIHQYDKQLFGALLGFLDAFRGAPMLLMTASLPRVRLRAIQKILSETGRKLGIIKGPADIEGIPRYRLHRPTEAPPWEFVEKTLADGGKVLWVANTVERAVRFASEAESRNLGPMLPYHSRYRYCDRVVKHEAVVSAFRPNRPGPILAVTTQVCEVSLDLSGDLLVSDLAPIPSLIQRLGRLNRHVTLQLPERPAPALFLEPDGILPYSKVEFDLEKVRDWLVGLSGRPVSQADLARGFEAMVVERPADSVRSAWLDGGPLSSAAPLREAAGTIPVVREEDSDRCVDQRRRPISREITRFAIPMPLGPVAGRVGGWKRLSFVFVAPQGTIDYSEQWGARWVAS